MIEPATLSATDRAQALLALADTPLTEGGRSRRERWDGLVSRFNALVAAGAPMRELSAAWSYDLEPCRALTAAVCWSQDKRQGTLVLGGRVGMGKTVGAARYALSTSAAWCHAPLLALHDWTTADKRVQALIDAHHLVLDEVGGAGTTVGPAVPRIAAVLTARHAACRPTLVTTNLSQVEFARTYDDAPKPEHSRLLDRICDAGSWVFATREADPDTGKPRGSFRRDGGCGFERNRFRTAKEALHLLSVVEAGDIRQSVLDQLQAALDVDDACVQLTHDETAGQHLFADRIDELAAQLRSRTSE